MNSVFKDYLRTFNLYKYYLIHFFINNFIRKKSIKNLLDEN